MRAIILIVAAFVAVLTACTAEPTTNAAAPATSSANTASPSPVYHQMEGHPEFKEHLGQGYNGLYTLQWTNPTTSQRLVFTNESTRKGDNVVQLTEISIEEFQGEGAQRTKMLLKCGASSPRDVAASLKSFKELLAHIKSDRVEWIPLENRPGTFQVGGTSANCTVEFFQAATE